MLSPVIESLPAQQERCSTAGSGRPPEGGHGNPLQHSCLENLMDRGVWWATVHRVTKRCSRLKRLNTHTHTHTHTHTGQYTR